MFLKTVSTVCLDFRRGICYNNRTITNTRGGVASAGCRRRSKSTQWPVVSVWLALICETHVFLACRMPPVHMESMIKIDPVSDVQMRPKPGFVLPDILVRFRRQTIWNGVLCFSSTVPCWA